MLPRKSKEEEDMPKFGSMLDMALRPTNASHVCCFGRSFECDDWGFGVLSFMLKPLVYLFMSKLLKIPSTFETRAFCYC